MTVFQQRLFDKEVITLVSRNINLSVPFYIMACYAYYEEDDPILEDKTFDTLARLMKAKWNEIEHFHKSYITYEDLVATTYLNPAGYPRRAIGSLRHIKKWGVRVDAEN